MDQITKVPWLTERFRLTAFFDEGGRNQPQFDLDEAFNRIFSFEAQSVQRNKQTNTRIVQGELENGLCQAATQTSRIDITRSQIDINNGRIAFLPFLESAISWIAGNGPWVRLAYGQVYVVPVDSTRKANAIFRDLLSRYVNIDVDTTEDLLYRVNRKRKYMNLTVNRLSTWSEVMFQLMSNQLNPSSLTVVQSTRFVRLETDISTSGDNAEANTLQSEEICSLLNHFASMSDEISEKGDVP